MAENSAEYQAWVAEEEKELAVREKDLDLAHQRDLEEEEELRRRYQERGLSASPARRSSYPEPWGGRWRREDDEESYGDRAESIISDHSEDEECANLSEHEDDHFLEDQKSKEMP